MENINDKKEKIIDLVKRVGCIIFYFIIMELLVNPLADLLKIIMNGADNYLITIVFEYVVYGILLIVSCLLMTNEIKSSFKVLKEKTVGLGFKEVGLGFLLCYGASYFGNIIIQMIGSSATDSANEQAIDSLFSYKYGFLVILVITVIGPIVEELVFRGAIMGGLGKMRVHPVVSILISGTIFGFMHVLDAGDYIMVFPYIFIGIALGFVYYKSQNIVTVISIHILLNAVSTSLSYLLLVAEKIGLFGTGEEAFVLLLKMLG